MKENYPNLFKAEEDEEIEEALATSDGILI